MFKLQVLHPHTENGKRFFAGQILEVESAIEAEKLLRKTGNHFKYFRVVPGTAVPGTHVAAVDPTAEKTALAQAEQAETAKLMEAKAAEEKAAEVKPEAPKKAVKAEK